MESTWFIGCRRSIKPTHAEGRCDKNVASSPSGIVVSNQIVQHERAPFVRMDEMGLLEAVEPPDDRVGSVGGEIERLRQLALHDELTGLPNRRAFLDRLRDEIARGRRHGHSFSLLLLDLNGLKDLNDTFGHQAGDAALCAFAMVLQEAVRTEDLVARIGGDEFAIIGVHGEGDESGPFAERIGHIASGVLRHIGPAERVIQLSAACGAATWGRDVRDADTLFARAESKLLAAKRSADPRSDAPPGVFRPRGRQVLGEELRRLLATALQVSSARELGALCRAAVEQCAALVGAQSASIALERDNGIGYDYRLLVGEWYHDPWRSTRHAGIPGWVMTRGQPLVIDRMSPERALDPAFVAMHGAPNLLCLPLRGYAGRVIGVLTVADKQDGLSFSDTDVNLGLAFADLVASAIENLNAQDESRAASEYTRSLMEQSYDAIYIIDPVDGRILDANGAAQQMSGYTLPELQRLTEADLHAIDKIVDEPGAAEPIRHLYRRKDGTHYAVEVGARLVRTPRGEVSMHNVRDLTLRIAAEEEVRRRNRELQARNDVAAALARVTDDDTALDHVLRVVRNALGASSVLMVLRDAGTGALRRAGEVDVPAALLHLLDREAELAGTGRLRILLAGETLVVEDTAKVPDPLTVSLHAAGLRSAVVTPMVTGGVTTGVLAAASRSTQHFSAADVSLTRTIADQVALWAERDRLARDARQREQDARFLADLGNLLNRTADHAQMLRRLARRVSEGLAKSTAVFLPESDSGAWELGALYDARAAQRDRLVATFRAMPFPVPDELAGWAAHGTEPRLLQVADESGGAGAMLRSLGLQELMLVPLRFGDRTLGLMALGATVRDRRFNERDRRLAEEIGRGVAPLLANALTRRDLMARNRELRLLSDVAALVQRAVTAKDLHDRVVRRLQRGFRSRAAVLHLWDARTQSLSHAAAAGIAGPTGDGAPGSPAAAVERLGELVSETGQAQVVSDVVNDARLSDVQDTTEFRSAISVPLTATGDLMGVVTLVSSRPRAFTASDVRLLQTAAERIAASLARLQAFELARWSADYAHDVFLNAREAMLLSHPTSGTILSANPAAEVLTGWNRAELTHMTLNSLNPWWPVAAPADAPGLSVSGPVERLRRKDGSEVLVETRVTTVHVREGGATLTAIREVNSHNAEADAAASPAVDRILMDMGSPDE